MLMSHKQKGRQNNNIGIGSKSCEIVTKFKYLGINESKLHS